MCENLLLAAKKEIKRNIENEMKENSLLDFSMKIP